MSHSPDNTTPAGQFFNDIQRSVSRQRLAPYRHVQGNKTDALALYLYNVALSEALYPCLQAIEIVLRNAVHDALKKIHGNAAWFDEPHLLLTKERERLAAAKQTLADTAKSADPGRIVAELTFGFWASLFSAGYTNSIVYPIIGDVFHNAPSEARTQQVISARLQAIRHIRNRVFHHEPIQHWPNLLKDHSEIIEIIGWISPSHCKYLLLVDRFSAVLETGWQAYQFQVQFLFEELNEAGKAASADHPIK